MKNHIATKFKGTKSTCAPCHLRAECLRKPEITEIRQVAYFHGRSAQGKATFTEKMKHKIDSAIGRFIYGKRLGTVEPVFANICSTIGLSRFSLRGRNKVNAQWQMFWDGRVQQRTDNSSYTPVRRLLLTGLDNALAAQAMFPATSDTEMRGDPGESDLGTLPDWEYRKIWGTLTKRLLAIEGYRTLFKKAYPDIALEDITFAQAANAIAAFEEDAFTLEDAPFDRYLRGEKQALNVAEKRGALVFYTKGECVRCHTGPLFTDQDFHCRLVPQVGPGKESGIDGLWDYGRGEVTGLENDLFCFRTPPLRNVAETGPWMHDGAFTTLEAAVRHEINPYESAKNYDVSQLPEAYQKTYLNGMTDFIIEHRWDLKMVDDYGAVHFVDEQDISDLIAFLKSLTSPHLAGLTKHTPASVPSGLPVAD